MTAHLGVSLLAVLLLLCGAFCLLPCAPKAILRFPRSRIGGILLTCVCMTWVTVSLYYHPIDFLAFITPTRLFISGILLTSAICIFLQNLLCARAFGGLLMLWPMPIILLTRDYLTAWRLIPITIGYISLTLGMFAAFHPWRVRIASEILAEKQPLRTAFAVALITAGTLCLIALTQFEKVVGQ